MAGCLHLTLEAYGKKNGKIRSFINEDIGTAIFSRQILNKYGTLYDIGHNKLINWKLYICCRE